MAGIPKQIKGVFFIGKKKGSGGFGQVNLAKMANDRKVAIKFEDNTGKSSHETELLVINGAMKKKC